VPVRNLRALTTDLRYRTLTEISFPVDSCTNVQYTKRDANILIHTNDTNTTNDGADTIGIIGIICMPFVY